MELNENEALKPPDASGRFGNFGGRFVPETLMPACLELEKAFNEAWADPSFRKQLDDLLADYAGRPSPLTDCPNLSELLGCRVLLKREDLNHTGSHKINNVLGQALLAQRMGKTRLVAETGAGQHGVATATAAALLGMECCVYMGEVDVERQKLNVFRMRLLGAEVRTALSGSRTLKDAINEAMRDWVATVEESHYCLGSVMGPHPYPWMVRTFHEVLGSEARIQCQERLGTTPDVVVACVGGGSNAIGLFHPFLSDEKVMMYGVEAGGHGVETGQHAAPLSAGVPGVLHGNRTYLMQDQNGQIMETHSVSAGLDYPGVGPEHSWLKDIGRVNYVAANDDEALAAFHHWTRTEGIMPALETAHALAYAEKLAAEMTPEQHIIVNLSGRGDKDILTVAAIEGIEV